MARLRESAVAPRKRPISLFVLPSLEHFLLSCILVVLVWSFAIDDGAPVFILIYKQPRKTKRSHEKRTNTQAAAAAAQPGRRVPEIKLDLAAFSCADQSVLFCSSSKLVFGAFAILQQFFLASLPACLAVAVLCPDSTHLISHLLLLSLSFLFRVLTARLTRIRFSLALSLCLSLSTLHVG